MNAELLYEALNDSHSLEQLNEQELGRLVSTYPYFSIGQLLLAKKLKQHKDSESYQRQRENLHAFYRNPWWLYYQLELTDRYATPPYVSQKPYRYEPPHPSAPFESIAQSAAPHLGAGTPHPFEEVEQIEAIIPEVPPPAEPVEAPAGPEVPAPSEPSDPPPPPEMPTPSVPEVPAPEPHRQSFTPWPGMEEEEMEIPTLMGATPYGSEHVVGERPVEEEHPKQEAEPYLPYMLTSAVAEMPLEPATVEAPPEVPVALPEAIMPAEVSEAIAPPEVPEAIVPSEVLEAVAAPIPDPTAEEDPDDTDGPQIGTQEGTSRLPHGFPTGEPAPFPFSITPLAHDFTFEPLHTVDYFASQGIKLNLDENPNDNLTRHLKSFTEWLRAMKRVSPMDNLRGELDAATEAEIQQLASSANHQREAIVTESMAHVWVLQGKIHKAVEVYNKLSLQHPEKRAYFAAKIEQLNKL